MFRKTSVASLAFILLSSVAFSAESLPSDREINSRSIESITANLAEYQGIQAEDIEAYGDKILVHAKDANGGNSVLFFDKDTLQPISTASRVGTNLDVVQTQPTKPSPARRLGAHETAYSLTEIYD
jgi:hypothetical protein